MENLNEILCIEDLMNIKQKRDEEFTLQVNELQENVDKLLGCCIQSLQR